MYKAMLFSAFVHALAFALLFIDPTGWLKKDYISTPPPAFVVALEIDKFSEKTNIPNPIKSDLISQDPIELDNSKDLGSDNSILEEIEKLEKDSPAEEPKPETPQETPPVAQEPIEQLEPKPDTNTDRIDQPIDSKPDDQPVEEKNTDSESIFEDIKDMVENLNTPTEVAPDPEKTSEPNIEDLLLPETKPKKDEQSEPAPAFVPKTKPKDLAELSLKKKKEKEKKAKKKDASQKSDSLEDIFADVNKKTDKNSGKKGKKVAYVNIGEFSITEEDAIKAHMRRCWLFPAGARDPKKLIAQLILDIGPDGTVKNVKITDEDRMNQDTFFRAAAESAVRAVSSPDCKKLPLNLENYEKWKKKSITFDPKDMFK